MAAAGRRFKGNGLDVKGAGMSNFRAYVIGPDGHVTLRVDLDKCADDSEALESAKRLVDGHDVEVWEGPRN